MRSPSRLIGLSAVAALAIHLVFESGSRGFQAFDQSILFDGGYRLLLGQRPYRDFFLPTGPVPAWIQAAFFALGGVDYDSYLMHAAVVNAAAALLAFAVVRLMLPSESALFAYLAAVLTAFWFYPPFGTPWFEQTAFFFHLVGAVAILVAVRSERPRWAAVTGVAVVLSFLSKQNVGALSLLACGIMILAVGNRRRLLAWTAGGGAAASGAFLLWVAVRSRWDWFWLFFVRLPWEEGSRRLDFLQDLLFEELSLHDPVRASSTLAFLLASSVLLTSARRRYALAATGILSLFAIQSVFIHITNNEPENAFAFSGLIAALGLALGHALLRDVPAVRLALVLASLVAGLQLAGHAREVALTRRVHDVFFRSSFDEEVVSEALRPVRWALPTPAARRRSLEIHVEDVDRLARFLANNAGNFFVFPDYSVLYGLTGKIPPQPLLWFHRGLTYPREPTPWLDARIVSDLERNRVTRVVLESESLTGMAHRLSDFPRVERFIVNGFEPERDFGIFRVLKRRSAP